MFNPLPRKRPPSAAAPEDDARQIAGESRRELSDEALLDALGEGFGHALDVLFARYGARVKTYLRHLIGDASQAEDLTQEVFIAVLHMSKSGDRSSEFRVWVFRVAHNKAIDHMRRTRSGRTTIMGMAHRLRSRRQRQETHSQGPDAELARSELDRALEASLAQLTDAHREVFLLREREGLSYDDIGTIQGCSAKTVSTRIHRARLHLRELLRPYLGESQ